MTESDTLENLADRLYGSPYLYWVLLFMNKAFDPLWDMPLNNRDFEKYIETKYGSLRNASAFFEPYMAVYTANGTPTITVNTTPNDHNMQTGDMVYLDFSPGIGNLLSGTYKVTVLTPKMFTVVLPQIMQTTATPVSVQVSPPFISYYMKFLETDPEFFKTDKITYDKITNVNLKMRRSAYDEERIINENKKIILVLKPEFLNEFVDSFLLEISK